MLVNGRYQFREIGLSLAANVLTALLVACLLSWFYLIVMDGGVVVNHNRQIPLYLGGATLFVVVAAAWWTLYRSRSVAGMMRKIDIIMSGAARGIFPKDRLVFRRGDSFSWLATPLNNCLVRMQQQQQCIEEVVPELEGLIMQLKNGDISQDELKTALNRGLERLNAVDGTKN